MTPDEENNLIGEFTQEAWNVWVKAGWLEGIGERVRTTPGPSRVFHLRVCLEARASATPWK
jgi:hypothetical protein